MYETCLVLEAFPLHPITASPVVGYREVAFLDEGYQQSRNMLIWYPVDPQTKGTPSSNPWDVFDVAIEAPISHPQVKKPLMIISHGYGGSPHQLSWLINKFVYHDYVVLGIQHLDELGGKPQINHWKRAQDIQMLLDQFTLQPFAKFSDLHRIGFAGFSVGGTTGVWLIGGRSTRLDHIVPGPSDAYPEEFHGVELALSTLDKKKMAQSWEDKRIKAALLMAPAWAWIFDKEGLKNITIPTYIVASAADQVLFTQNNAGFFSKSIPGAVYQVIPGQVSHYVFIAAPKEKDKIPSNLSFLMADTPGVDREWIQFEVAREAFHFFQSTFSHLPKEK